MTPFKPLASPLCLWALLCSSACFAQNLPEGCAADMRSEIAQAQRGLRSLDRMPRGADFHGAVSKLIGQVGSASWESATSSQARELGAEADHAGRAVKDASESMAALGGKAQEYRRRAQGSSDPKTWAALQTADDEVAAGSYALEVMRGLTAAAKKFSICVAR